MSDHPLPYSQLQFARYASTFATSSFPERRVTHIQTAFHRQSCLGNMITACRFLGIKEFFLNRKTKKQTSLSSDSLVASSRRNDRYGCNESGYAYSLRHASRRYGSGRAALIARGLR